MSGIPAIKKANVTNITGNGTTATCSLDGSLGLAVGDRFTITGSIPLGYNGLKTVKSVTVAGNGTSTLTFASTETGSLLSNHDFCVAINSSYTTSTSYTLSASGDGNNATLVLTNPLDGAYIGDTITVSGMTPTGYNGDWEILTYTTDVPYSVTFRCTTKTAQTVQGTVRAHASIYSGNEFNNVGTGLAKLSTLNRDTVESVLKSQMQTSNGWKYASQVMFGQGALDTTLPFPLALLKAIGTAITRNGMGQPATIQDALTSIQTHMDQFSNSSGKLTGDIGFGVMDGSKTVSTFLTELWQAATGQSGTGKTVSQVTTAIGGLKNTADQASENATSAGDLALEVISSGANLIKNPGFESIWFQQLGSSFSGELVRSGSKSLKITGNGLTTNSYVLLSDSTTQRFLTVGGGDILYAEVWVAGKSTNVQTSGGTNAIKMLFEPYGGVNNALTTSSFSVTASTVLNGNWTKLSGFVTMPTGTARLKVSLQLSPGVPSTDSYYFDDVVVREVTLAQAAAAAADTSQTAADAANAVASNADVTIQNLASSGNLVIGPNFELPAIVRISYGSPTVTYSTAEKYLGSRSLKFTTTAATWQGIYLAPTMDKYIYDVKPGDTYNVKVKLKPQSGNAITAGYVRLFVRWFNNGAYLSDAPGYTQLNNSALLAGWQDFTCVATAPANADSMTVFIVADPTTTVGNSYYLDAAQVREETSVQGTVDGIHQSINGGTTTGNGIGTVFTNMQTAWSNFWDGLNGSVSTTATGKKPADVFTVGAATRTQANLGVTNANAADVKAVTAQTLIEATSKAGANLIPDPSFEDSSFDTGRATTFAGGGWTHATDKPRTGTRSLKVVSTAGYHQWLATPTLKSNGYIPVTAGQVFYCSVWVYANDINAGTNRIENYLELSTTAPGTGINYVVFSGGANVTDGVWTKVSGYAIVPDNGSKWMRLYACGVRLGTVSNDTFWFDDIELYDVTEAYNAQTDVNSTIDAVHQSINGGSTTGNNPATVKTNLQSAWSKFWDGLSGNLTMTATGKLPSDVYTVGAATRTQANLGVVNAGNADNKAQQTVDAVVQAVDGGTATGATPATTKTKLESAWNNFWDGLQGNLTMASTGKRPSDVYTVGAATRTQANLGVNNANAAQTAADTAHTRVEVFAAGGAGNICTNPGFEDTGQYLLNGTFATTPARSGSRSAKLTGAGAQLFVSLTSTRTAQAFINSGPSRTYYVEVWAYGDAGNTLTGTGNHVGIGVWGYTTAGAYVSGSAGVVYYSADQIGKSGWVKLSGTVTLSSGTTIAKASPMIVLSTLTPAGNSWYFDDAIVRDITEADVADGKADAADTKAQNTVDAVVQAVDGGSATGATPATTKTKLESAWNNFWDGLSGNLTMTATNKRPTDVYTVGAATRTQANLGVTNAGNADNKAQQTVDAVVQAVDGGSATGATPATTKTKLESAWNNFWDGLNGNLTMTATGKRPSDVFTVGSAARTQANLGVSNASTAQTAANKATSLAKDASLSGTNICTNGGFEDNNYWASATYFSTTQKRTGAQSLKMTGNGASQDYFVINDGTTSISRIPATAGDVFQVEFWVYGDTLNAGGGTITFYMTAYNNALASLGSPAITYTPIPAEEGVWTKVTGTISFPSNATYNGGTTATTMTSIGARIRLNTTIPVGDVYYFDDVIIREVTLANTATTAAATADTKAQNTVDAVVQAVDGGSATGAVPGTAKTKLESAWNNFWDGLSGNLTMTATNKRPSDVFTVGSATRTQANLGVTNASNADSKAQQTVDAVVQAVDGGTATGATPATTKTKLESAWNNFWDGLNNSATASSTGKRPSDVFTVGKAARTKAEDAFTNAGTADGKAVIAQNVIDLKSKDFTNLLAGSDFDVTSPPWSTTNGFAFDTTVPAHSSTKSLKITAPTVAGASIFYGTTAGTVTYFEVKPGEQFYMELWARETSDYSTDTSGPRFRLIRGNGPLAGQTIGNIYVNSAALTVANTWQKFSTTVTIPDDGTSSIAFYFTSTATVAGFTAGSVSIDDIVVRRIALPEHVAALPQAKVTGLTTDLGANATNIQATVDSIVQAVDGGSATGAAPTAAKTKLESAWNNFWDGLQGNLTMTATGKRPTDVFTVGSAARTQANLGVTNAGLADTKAQQTVDAVVQAVDGTTATGATPATTKTKLESAWNNFWDGLNNSATASSTGKRPADVFTVGKAARTKAEDAFTNAGTADSKAVIAQNVTNTYIASGSNICPNPSFENTSFFLSQSNGSYSTDVARTGTRSIKLVANPTASCYIISDTTALRRVPVQPGDVFYCEFYVYGKAVADATPANAQTTGGTNGIRMVVNFENTASVNISYGILNQLASTALNGVWTKVSGYVTAPAGAAQMRAYVDLLASVTTGETYYIDDVTIQRVTEGYNADAKAVTADGKAVDLYSRVDQYIAGGANLCTNPTFEDSTQYLWEGTYSTASGTFAPRTGTRSAKLAGNGTDQYIELSSNKTTNIYINSSPSRTFAIEYYVYGDTANTLTGTASTIGVGLWTYTTANAFVSTSVVYTNANTVGKDAWVKVSGIVTLAATTTIAKIRPLVYVTSAVAAPNSFYFDDIKITDITEAYAADGKAQNTVDAVVQAVDGGVTTGAAPASAKTKLQLAWSHIWDGLNGSATQTSTTKAATDLFTVAKSARLQANDGVTNAGLAQTAADQAKTLVFDAAATGTNILPNPGFENSSFALPGIGAVYNTNATYVYRGAKSLQITASASNPYAYLVANETTLLRVPTVPTDVYYLECYVKGNAANVQTTGGTGAIRLGVTWYTTANTGTNIIVASLNATSALNTGWTKMSGYVTMPANAASFTPYVQVASTAIASTVYETYYFDECVVKEFTQTQSVIDNLHQAVNGGSTTGNSPATVKSNLEKAWANLFDGLNGSATQTSTSKSATELFAVAKTARQQADDGVNKAVATNTAVYNGFFVSGGTGTSAETQTAVAAIKTAIAGGWTVETLTTSGTWTRPVATGKIIDFWAICIGGGGGGGSGTPTGTGGAPSGRYGANNTMSAAGGLGGIYVAQQINPADVTSTVSYTIGAGATGRALGSNTPASVAPTTTNFGSLATTAGFQYSAISSAVGFYDSMTSAPGDGANTPLYGSNVGGNGLPGNSTPLAAGGAAGVSSAPAGGAGGNASLTGQSRCGGAGGGSGYSYGTGSTNGGAGGNGGFPGGGGGGGGKEYGGLSGAGGNGANGVIILVYKVAA